MSATRDAVGSQSLSQISIVNQFFGVAVLLCNNAPSARESCQASACDDAAAAAAAAAAHDAPRHDGSNDVRYDARHDGGYARYVFWHHAGNDAWSHARVESDDGWQHDEQQHDGGAGE